jgi:hypothetical protein
MGEEKYGALKNNLISPLLFQLHDKAANDGRWAADRKGTPLFYLLRSKLADQDQKGRYPFSKKDKHVQQDIK